MYRTVPLLDPVITEALRPVMSRAFYGGDWDCVRLLSSMTAVDHEPVILEKKCDCCREAGTTCIAALCPEDPQYPFPYISGRCVQCVLSGRKCDLPLRTKLPLCTCSWLLNPTDRAHEERHAFLHRLSVQQACVPRNQQWSKHNRLTLSAKLRSHDLKFTHKTREALELSTDLLIGMAEVLGRQSADLHRPDGTWVIPPRSEWQQCQCYPDKCRGHEKGKALKKVRKLVDRDTLMSPPMSPNIMSPLMRPIDCLCGGGVPLPMSLPMSPSISNASLTSTILQTPPARSVKVLPPPVEAAPAPTISATTPQPKPILDPITSPPSFLNGLPRIQNHSSSSFDGDSQSSNGAKSICRSPISVGSIVKKVSSSNGTPRATPTHTPTGSFSKASTPETPRRRGDKIRRLSAMFNSGALAINDIKAK